MPEADETKPALAVGIRSQDFQIKPGHAEEKNCVILSISGLICDKFKDTSW